MRTNITDHHHDADGIIGGARSWIWVAILFQGGTETNSSNHNRTTMYS